MSLTLKGLHHVSAITGKAQENFKFYTEVLGLRLIKKTVNQDDISVYHLFYGDEKGNPGTELTFFELPMAAATARAITASPPSPFESQAMPHLPIGSNASPNLTWSMGRYRYLVDARLYPSAITRVNVSFSYPTKMITVLPAVLLGLKAQCLPNMAL